MFKNQDQAPKRIIDFMDRQIFKQNLSVSATSAYILITACLNHNLSTNYATLMSRWTVSEEELKKALEELIAHKIVISAPGGSDDDTLYSPQPASMWRLKNID